MVDESSEDNRRAAGDLAPEEMEERIQRLEAEFYLQKWENDPMYGPRRRAQR